MLSQLESQNSSLKELIFGMDGVERMNACIVELKENTPIQKLFVWEVEPEERKKESNKQLIFIIAIFLFLLLAKFLK